MAIPGSRTGKAGDGRGYPRPRPAYGDSRPRNDYGGDRPRSNFGSDRPRREDGESISLPVPPRPSVPKPPEAPALSVEATPVATAPQFVLTDDIRDLIKMVADTDLTEVLLETPDWKVQIKREKQTAVVEYSAAPVHAAPTVSAPSRAGHAALAQSTAPTVEDNYHKVTAPMVGIYYRSPDPKARPFVQEGEMVEKGQTVGIIEAMKIMNEIVSEHSGRCVRLNVDNGQPVEYGQTLLLLEPA